MLRGFASHDSCQLQEIADHQIQVSFGGRLLHHDTGALFQGPGDKAGAQSACRCRLKIRGVRRHKQDLGRCASEQGCRTEIVFRVGFVLPEDVGAEYGVKRDACMARSTVL
jgi:hypothetical protein